MYSNESSKKSKSSGGSKKRSKKGTWGSRERTSMSFLIVIAFFAVFGIIILTEVLMIDDRNSVTVRRTSINNRFSESLPDYEDVKDDYADEAGIFVRENRFASASAFSSLFKKSKKSDPSVQEKMMAGIPVAPDTDSTPWGQILPSKIEANLPPYPNEMKPKDGDWQIVNGTRFKFFVFSAFYDRRDGRMIRVIAATKTRGPEKVWCRMWYPVDSNNTRFRSISVMARVKVIRENWNLKYSAVFILCPLRISYLDVPYSVSIVSKLRSPPGNILMLRNTDSDPDFANRSVTNIPNKIAVCVKPLHFNYDQALYMLEFLELNNLLGVSHFTFYNHTIGQKAQCVLQHYMDGKIPQHFAVNSTGRPNHGDKNATSDNATTSGVTRLPQITVDLLPWNLKMKSQKEIRTEGLFASLNDCLYRSMYRYSHVALIDLDEFIIPRHNDTISEMLEWLSKRINNKNTGAYSFQNAFFYLQFANDETIYDKKSSNPQLRASLVTQKKTRRRQKLHPQKQRSKYICKPEAVIEAGNHFVWEFCPGRGSLNVPSNSAILHHYRVCEFGGDDCIKSPSVEDKMAHKYGSRLVERVSAIYDYLREPCKLSDIPPVPTRPPTVRKKVLRIGKLGKNSSGNNITISKLMEQHDVKIKKIVFP